MSYTTPITDRTYADVVNRTSKGYFNVADWARVYNNSLYVYQLVTSAIPISPVFGIMALPGISEFPSANSESNDYEVPVLTSNIEYLRLALVAYGINVASTAVFYAWEAGLDKVSPDYRDVNLWEQTIDLIYQFFQHQNRHARTGIARCGSGLTRQNGFRR